jgi:6-pyruvoyltetrahydropterin/6-carboxytetrahydropterin synthase
MKTKIAKDFYWEMSHRLPFHKGPCRNIHGHSYKIRVEITGRPDTNGIVLDYYDLKILMKPIIEELDHSFVVDKDDKLMIDFLKENDMKFHIIEKTTTAENLAEYIFEQVKERIKNKFQNLTELTIRLFETDDVYAEVSGTINN